MLSQQLINVAEYTYIEYTVKKINATLNITFIELFIKFIIFFSVKPSNTLTLDQKHLPLYVVLACPQTDDYSPCGESCPADGCPDGQRCCFKSFCGRECVEGV